nr:branched-chain amino acid ABC transporter permease [Pusillimonas noertemannii]
MLFAALLTGALYAIVAVGLNMVYGTMRLLNVAHGDIVMIGAYAAYWLFTAAGVSPLWSLFVVAGGCALLGMGLYKVLLRRVMARPASTAQLEANSLLLFFGLSLLIQNAMVTLQTATPRAYTYFDQVYRVGALAMTGNRLLSLLVALAVCAAIALFLQRSIFGLALRAVIERSDAARIVGVNVERVHLISLALGFGAAGVAGVLISMMEQFSPFIGFPMTIAAFIVIILGGLGNISAGFAAAMLLGAIEVYGVALTSPNMRSVLLYGVFVLALILLPKGLFPRRFKK